MIVQLASLQCIHISKFMYTINTCNFNLFISKIKSPIFLNVHILLNTMKVRKKSPILASSGVCLLKKFKFNYITF